MAGFEFATMLALMFGGGDIVSSLPAKEYFAYREIEPTVEKLVELAQTEPASGKAQIAQLFALRQLAHDIDAVTKSGKVAEIRQLLRLIADGKKANDAAGFAADYAGVALAALDGTKLVSRNRGGWREGAAWLPKETTLLAGFDSKDKRPSDAGADLSVVIAALPKQAKQPVFEGIEKFGNVRVDRIVLGVIRGKNDSPDMCVRITGKWNPTWALAEMPAGAKIAKRTIAGRSVQLIEPRLGVPALAIVDDSDVLVTGLMNSRVEVKVVNGKQAVVEHPADADGIEKMLALVAKPGDDALHGTLKDDLAKVPAAACGIVVGTIPAPMRDGAPFPMPERIFAHATRGPGGLDVRVKATMKGENDANQLVQTIAQGRDAALKQLAQLQGKAPPVPGMDLSGITSLLESIQLQSDGGGVQLQMLVPPNAMSNLPAWWIGQ